MIILKTQEANYEQWKKNAERNKRQWQKIFDRMRVKIYLRNIIVMLAVYFGIAIGFMLLGWIVTSLT